MAIDMTIDRKLRMAFGGMTLAIVALVAVVVSFMVVDKLQIEAYKRLNNDLDVTMHTFNYFSDDALKTANMLAQNPDLIAKMRKGDTRTLAARCAHFHSVCRETIVSVYNSQGGVVYDGGDVATLKSPRRHPASLNLALAGESSKGVAVLPGNALAVEATVPIVSGREILGAVRIGTKLDDAFVDQLKGITGLEVGIAESFDLGTVAENKISAHWLAQTLRDAEGKRIRTEVPIELISKTRELGIAIRRPVTIDKVSYLAAVAPLYGAYGEFVGALVIAEDVTPLHAAARDMVTAIAVVALVLMLLGALAIKWLALTITEPIRALASQAACISQGQLDKRVQVRGGGELGKLAEAFNRMGEALQEMQYRDQNANPLTKLPGNLMIEAECNRRLGLGEQVAVLYIDLDHFKAFNDKFGFEAGDRVITLTADILRSVCGENGPANVKFVGHIGGDDFIVITRPDNAEETCQLLCAEFDRRVIDLYPAEDRERGYIMALDRQGQLQTFPLCSISIAWVDNQRGQFVDFLEMSSLAAEVKKYAKGIPGSSYARDRRSEREASLRDW